MDMSEKEYVAVVINYFGDAELVTPDQVNEHVASVAYEALQSAAICSAAMDMVPRPTYGLPDMKYIVKQLVDIGKRIAERDGGIYFICKLGVTDAYITKIKLSLIGL
jgi:hypothetical protein